MAEASMSERREGEPYDGNSDEERAHYGEGGAAKPDVDEETARAEADKQAQESRERPKGEGGHSTVLGEERPQQQGRPSRTGRHGRGGAMPTYLTCGNVGDSVRERPCGRRKSSELLAPNVAQIASSSFRAAGMPSPLSVTDGHGSDSGGVPVLELTNAELPRDGEKSGHLRANGPGDGRHLPGGYSEALKTLSCPRRS
jgi:hypothetical protein